LARPRIRIAGWSTSEERDIRGRT